MPVYAASKAGLDGFGRALAEEWRGAVTVRVLHPGPVATGMAARAGRSPISPTACSFPRARPPRRCWPR